MLRVGLLPDTTPPARLDGAEDFDHEEVPFGLAVEVDWHVQTSSAGASMSTSVCSPFIALLLCWLPNHREKAAVEQACRELEDHLTRKIR